MELDQLLLLGSLLVIGSCFVWKVRKFKKEHDGKQTGHKKGEKTSCQLNWCS